MNKRTKERKVEQNFWEQGLGIGKFFRCSGNYNYSEGKDPLIQSINIYRS